VNTRQRLTDPMPLLFYPEGQRFIYIAPGPAVLVFAIELKSIIKNSLISRQPVLQPYQHPFGEATCVCTLAETCVRKALATCKVVPEDDQHMGTLTLWCDFSDAAAERIHDGEELQHVMETTWRLSSATSPAPRTPPVVEDAGDVALDDEDSAAVA